MFKTMPLMTKMILGFGSLVAMTGILGFAAWNGLGDISTNVALDKNGTQCLDTLNKCALLRRDFAVHGFEVNAGDDQNAADKWMDAYGELTKQLEDLSVAEDLENADKDLIADILPEVRSYKTAFDKQADARRMKDAAFSAWGTVGGNVTRDLQKAIQEVIKPARLAAIESKDPDAIARWSEIAGNLDEQVIQPFLLMRIKAVYLLATDGDKQWLGYKDQLAVVNSGLDIWIDHIQGETELELVAQNIKGYFNQYADAGQQYYDGVLAERAADTEMATIASNIVGSVEKLQESLAGQMEAVTSKTNTLTLTLTAIAIVVGMLLAFIISRSIIKPLQAIFKGLKTFSNQELENTGTIFKRIIDGLIESTDQVNDAGSQVSAASQQLAEGASEQASSLEETSSALEEVAAQTRTNAENSGKANDLAAQARNNAEDGDKTMGQLNTAMAAINESSSEISKIIKVIEEIAFQTNLLALNAAVEAARAGEHGKGFAVVAEEVRNLAQRSAQAARDTTALIEGSVTRAKEGSTVAESAGVALQSIVTDVAQVAELLNGITQASQEQSQGVDQVNTAVAQMDKVTQQNAAGAEECASAAEQLSAQAQTVKGMVDDLAAMVGDSDSAGGSSSGRTKTRATPTLVKAGAPAQPGMSESVNAFGPLDGSSDNDLGDF